ncbi:hypothetical protein ACJRO7_036296 [Eucalyptus globulus]|uniref:Protein kinase domain-containing protein n=1 Tax=Eucalyptus globulus TaxID=34317 RepID=A0ABD3IFY3_EUCGL
MINSLGSIFMYRVFLLILHILLLGTRCSAKKTHLCAASSCGEVRNIRYPFRLKDDPKDCGLSKYELACESNSSVLYLHGGRYYVKSIHYDFYKDDGNFFTGKIMLVDDGLQKGNCSSLPRHSLARSDFSDYHPFFPTGEFLSSVVSVAFLRCLQPVNSSSYVRPKPCIEGAYSTDTPTNFSQKVYSYAVHGFVPQVSDIEDGYNITMNAAHGFGLRASDIQDSCTITRMTFASNYIRVREGKQYDGVSLSYKDLQNMISEGFNLSYGGPYPSERRFGFCFLGFRYGREGCHHYYSHNSSRGIMDNVALNAVSNLAFVFGHFVVTKFILGAPFVLTILIYKWKRRHLAVDKNIEEFLQAHNNFLPIRYSYSDIKKITRNFRYRLGEGGYGLVYKGILRSGHEVAVKILNKPKSNGQDFISEVATIGWIHHVNVVQLVGFCFDNSKQALIYEFMSNGSLDKHIFSKDGYDSLNYKEIYEISLGVARGIEYIHRGCNMQILHFDIKPHNILLDQNFTPKVSDFGLAKLYPTDHGIVSLTAARGTLGYIAPENIGDVSYKADVYSFGMLLMEMATRRRNFNSNVERSSQIYFPMWVHDQLSKENGVEMEEVEEEIEITKKMIIVALWCIQLIPNDRPSMSKVLNMLEGDIDKMQLPLKPLLYPSEKPTDDVNSKIELESFLVLSSDLTISNGCEILNSNEYTSCVV